MNTLYKTERGAAAQVARINDLCGLPVAWYQKHDDLYIVYTIAD
jgi:hypothetical protein